ncbi:MAG TPA: hypothetical protein VGI39_36460 [Polyangiaceae bacterium]
MKWMTRAVVAVSFILCPLRAWAQPPIAPEVAPPPPEPTPAPAAAPLPPPPPPPLPPAPADWAFALHGIVGASFYVQDSPLFVLNGQGPLLLLGAAPKDQGFVTGADIRQSRFNFSVAGPRVFGGAIPKAVLEIDLFGLNSPGGFGEVSAYERVRLAYAELKWDNDVIRFGQDHQLIIALIPEGMGHMAFPATYTAGLLGWREPGIGYFHTVPIADSETHAKAEFALQVMKSDWANPSDFGTDTKTDLNVDLGQLSGFPGVEARAKFSNDHFMAFVAGHWNHVQGTHAGDLPDAPAAIPTRNWDVLAATVGVKFTAGKFSLLANGYMGQNTAPMLGEQLVFTTSNDVFEVGGWAQALYAITPHLNVSVLGGTGQPKGSDVQAAAAAAFAASGKATSLRASNSVIGGMIRYQEGGFAVGPEFHHVAGTQMNQTGATTDVVGNQFMLSGMYWF